MKNPDRWSELARRARVVKVFPVPMPFGFEQAVLRRLARDGRENPIESWIPLLRPALGLALATAVLCVVLQNRVEQPVPASLLVETENLIQFAVLR
jgi:hypothetical protein